MTAVLRRLALLAVVAVLGIVGAGRHDLHDLTAERSLTLAEQTRQVLGRLRADVRVTAFLRRDEPGRVEAAALLDRYGKASGRVRWKLRDPDEAPGEVARLGVDPVFGGVAVQLGSDVRVVTSATEHDLTSAIAGLQRPAPVELCLTSGLGEAPLRSARDLLERDGYTLRTVDLLADPMVPDECDVVVLAGAVAPLGPASAALAGWMDADGRMLVLADPVGNVDLAPLLEPYGLAVDRGIVFEGDAASVVGGDVTAPIVRVYSSGHPVVRRLAPTYFPGVQGITIDPAAETRVPGLTTSRLADTSPAAYLETAPLEPAFDPVADRHGPITVAAAADRSHNDGSVIHRSRVVVVGDVDFATDGVLGEAGNATLLLRSVGWLAADDDLLALSSNLPADRPLRLTDGQVTYARLLTAGAVPTAFLLAGALVWAMRRSR